MNKKTVWYVIGGIVLGLSALTAACGIIEEENPPLPVATISPPFIPHTLDTRDDCLQCHSKTGIIPFPDNHGTRPSDVCQACHEQASAENGDSASSATSTPKVVSPEELYKKTCSVCHGIDRQGVSGLQAPALTPEFLSDRSDDEIKDGIANGSTTMPSFTNLSADELDDLIEFLRSPIAP